MTSSTRGCALRCSPARRSTWPRSPSRGRRAAAARGRGGGDPYGRAGERGGGWTLDGVLTADREPAIWALTQDYVLPHGSRRTRRGLLPRVRVPDYGPGLVPPAVR